MDRNYSDGRRDAYKERVALLAEGVDRNVLRVVLLAADPLSPSSRRAWIEIVPLLAWCPHFLAVALLAEGVDRNRPCCLLLGAGCCVALREEGVDRNLADADAEKDKPQVALLAEGVDRNAGATADLPDGE